VPAVVVAALTFVLVAVETLAVALHSRQFVVKPFEIAADVSSVAPVPKVSFDVACEIERESQPRQLLVSASAVATALVVGRTWQVRPGQAPPPPLLLTACEEPAAIAPAVQSEQLSVSASPLIVVSAEPLVVVQVRPPVQGD